MDIKSCKTVNEGHWPRLLLEQHHNQGNVPVWSFRWMGALLYQELPHHGTSLYYGCHRISHQ